MTTTTFSIGQTVTFTNGQPFEQKGEIVSINGDRLTVITCDAGMELWKAGYAVGDCIHVSQVKPTKLNKIQKRILKAVYLVDWYMNNFNEFGFYEVIKAKRKAKSYHYWSEKLAK